MLKRRIDEDIYYTLRAMPVPLEVGMCVRSRKGTNSLDDLVLLRSDQLVPPDSIISTHSVSFRKVTQGTPSQ